MRAVVCAQQLRLVHAASGDAALCFTAHGNLWEQDIIAVLSPNSAGSVLGASQAFV